VIEDLNEDHSHEGIALDMKNRQRYFEGRAGETKDSGGIDTSDLLQMMGNGAGDWKSRLVSVRSDRVGRTVPTNTPPVATEPRRKQICGQIDVQERQSTASREDHKMFVIRPTGGQTFGTDCNIFMSSGRV